jgi:MOSC domain-containing protein YiiM
MAEPPAREHPGSEDAAVVVSLQVGLPARRGTEGAQEDPRKGAWTSGIFKDPVAGPVLLGRLHFAGDGQADLEVHGGPDKAVLAYSAGHYPGWRAELGLDMNPGAFGENLTIAGQDERRVCIGDVYEIGEARVEVSQPRLPCWKLARKWGLPDLPARVVKSVRGGWYFRVLREGRIASGDPVTRIARPFPQWTVARVFEAYIHGADPETAAALAGCDALAEGWRESFRDARK